MIISDLQYMETVDTQELGLEGGGKYKYKKYNKYYKKYGKYLKIKKPVSIAAASADSTAVGGKVNIAKTATETFAAPGVATSSSKSLAATFGEIDGKH